MNFVADVLERVPGLEAGVARDLRRAASVASGTSAS